VNLDIAKFLDFGAELEMRVSKVYEKLSGLAGDESLSKRLISLSREEINHANILRTGKNYLGEMPDLFVGVRLKDEEMQKGLKDAGALLAEFDTGLSFREGLNRILQLETEFERIHLGASVEVREPSLISLFQALTKGDQNHIRILLETIAAFRGR
jgi:rubrerythrin